MRLVILLNGSISRPVKNHLGQGVLMLGEGKFRPPKLLLFLQHAACSTPRLCLKPDASLCTSYGIFSCIVHGKSFVSVRQTLNDLVLELTGLLSTNRPKLSD
jgi:hypothetical protein